MANAYWHKQLSNEPLFPDLLWSRPENRNNAGKLLIVGGNAHGFSAPAEAYSESLKAGIGISRVLLPDTLQKTVMKIFPEAEFAPSTKFGSFNQRALDSMLAAASWADGVLLAGDLGRSAETAIVLEKFSQKFQGQLVITKDAADYFIKSTIITNRPDTTFVLTTAQLQKLAAATKFEYAFTFDTDMMQLVDRLHEFTNRYSARLILRQRDTTYVASAGQVSTTKSGDADDYWRIKTGANAAVWLIQNPDKSFEALTTSVAVR